MLARLAVRGFTLIEMAIVLFIIGLLIAGLLGPLETQIEARDRQKTVDRMGEVVEALYGFALTNGRLPCPDTDGDGIANPVFVPGNVATATCTQTEGFLPWVELGVGVGDAWSNRFRYQVRNPHWTWPEQDGVCDGNTAPQEFDLCTTGNITVNTRGDNPATPSPTNEGKWLAPAAQGVTAVIVSHGRNGLGATSIDGIPRPPVPGTQDEAENTDGDAVIMARGYSATSPGCADDLDESVALCRFDDIVMWIVPAILNNRMVVAGRLP